MAAELILNDYGSLRHNNLKGHHFVTIYLVLNQTYMNHEVRILSTKNLSHDVIQFRLERPAGYQFAAGQATELSLTHPVTKGPAPFTFTGLNANPYLELTIKIYEAHNGLTAVLAKRKAGDTVIITDPWDSFTNKGPGVFIAGGAGITPFIALLRQMRLDGTVGDSQLLFSNKTADDIFLQAELKEILGDNYADIITRNGKGQNTQRIDESFLKKFIKDIQRPFYVCGPPGFVESLQNILKNIGASEQMVNISL
jgi:ferredoxin-NADP reductase